MDALIAACADSLCAPLVTQPQALHDAHGDLGTLSQIGSAFFYRLAGDPAQISIISDSQLAEEHSIVSFQHFLTKNNKNLRPVGRARPSKMMGDGLFCTEKVTLTFEFLTAPHPTCQSPSPQRHKYLHNSESIDLKGRGC